MGPGLYLGEEGLHISRREVLDYFGLADTPESWAHVEEVMVRQCRLRWPDVPIRLLSNN